MEVTEGRVHAPPAVEWVPFGAWVVVSSLSVGDSRDTGLAYCAAGRCLPLAGARLQALSCGEIPVWDGGCRTLEVCLELRALSFRGQVSVDCVWDAA